MPSSSGFRPEGAGWRGMVSTSVVDPDHFDTDYDPAFHFDTDPDPANRSGYRSLLYQRGNVPKTVPVLYIQLDLIFLVSRSAWTQPESVLY
jgi:hypothetical protein